MEYSLTDWLLIFTGIAGLTFVFKVALDIIHFERGLREVHKAQIKQIEIAANPTIGLDWKPTEPVRRSVYELFED